MKPATHVESLIEELRREYLEARKLATLSERAPQLRPIDQLGTVIRDERKQQGQTLQQLSELSGVGYATLSKIENGQTDIQLNTLTKVLNALGLKQWIG